MLRTIDVLDPPVTLNSPYQPRKIARARASPSVTPRGSRRSFAYPKSSDLGFRPDGSLAIRAALLAVGKLAMLLAFQRKQSPAGKSFSVHLITHNRVLFQRDPVSGSDRALRW